MDVATKSASIKSFPIFQGKMIKSETLKKMNERKMNFHLLLLEYKLLIKKKENLFYN